MFVDPMLHGLDASFVLGSGGGTGPLRVEQRAICEDGVASHRRGAAGAGGRNGGESERALEQKRAPADGKCEGNAGGDGTDALL